MSQNVCGVTQVDPVDVLHQRERLLAVRYGVDHAPGMVDGEDLESNDAADAEHWVEVYGELVGFLRGLGDPCSDPWPADGTQAGGLEERRAMRLERKIHELHLAFWTDRLRQLRLESGSDGTRGG